MTAQIWVERVRQPLKYRVHIQTQTSKRKTELFDDPSDANTVAINEAARIEGEIDLNLIHHPKTGKPY